jgi:hypothetical protein
VRTLILGFLLLAAWRTAVADDATKAPGPPAADAKGAAVTTAPATVESAKTTSQRSKKQSASAGQADVTSDAVSTAGAGTQSGDVKMSGMSILGNEDTPKSLALVPWKSSQLGEMPSVSRLLDSSAQPVDKDVFMRELAYFSFKSGAK